MSKKRKKKDPISKSIKTGINEPPVTDIYISSKSQPKINQSTYRLFPGPRSAVATLRIAFNKTAYADLISHSKSSLDNEVCGVLAGHIHHDESGDFIFVHTIIPGENTLQKSTNVTFTQETWNKIHQILEDKYPEMQILGWYHTHPGFGTEFSEMDIFIQQNFFPLPTQISLVSDPLSGEVAICINSDNGTEMIDRFWVDGREIRCRTKSPAAGNEKPDNSHLSEDIHSLEKRLNQFIQDSVDRRHQQSSFLTFITISILIIIVMFIGFNLYKSYFSEKRDPVMQNFGSVPLAIQVDDKTVLMQVSFQGYVINENPNKDNQEIPVTDFEKEKSSQEESSGGNQ
ncbi:Mov34/MPN/PAD-1 family protein [Thermodesulfobacteriota bacterium]